MQTMLFFMGHKACRVAPISISLGLSKTMDIGLVHCTVCLLTFELSPAFADTHCTYPRRDGQAELTWVAGYTLTVVLTGPMTD